MAHELFQGDYLVGVRGVKLDRERGPERVNVSPDARSSGDALHRLPYDLVAALDNGRRPAVRDQVFVGEFQRPSRSAAATIARYSASGFVATLPPFSTSRSVP